MNINLGSPLDKTMLTPSELAERTGIAVGTFARWRLEFGDGSHGLPRKGPRWMRITPGPKGKVRYPLAWVEEWERQRMEEAA